MKTVFPILGGALIAAHSLQSLAAQEQEPIFISAKAPITAQEFSGSVSVVSAEEIRASGATNIAEALEGLPGISIGISGGNAGEEIRIRGMAAEYGLILVDGKRIPNTERNISSSPGSRNRWVAMENIERIEVIRGAASSLYGADALSGVINIITKKATKEWRRSVTLNGRGFDADGGDGAGINIRAAGAINEVADVTFSVDHQKDDAIEDSAGLTIKSKRQVTNSQLNLGFNVNDTDRLNLGLLYGEESATDVDTSFFTGAKSSAELDQVKTLLSADYNTKIGDFNTQFAVSGAKTTVKQGSQDWKITENNLSVNIDGGLTQSQYLSAGIEYREEAANRYDRNFADKFKSWSGYVQDVVDINDSNAVTIGFSFEDHNKYGNKLSPKLYWNWSVDPQWTVKAGYAEGRIAPGIREGSSKYVIPAGPTRTYQGNDDLKPEESKTMELSAAYNKGNLSASFALFNSDITDLISTSTTTTNGKSLVLYSNVNKARIRGLESSFTWKTSQAGKLSFNYTFLDTENRSGSNSGKDIVKRPKHTANLKYSQYVNLLDSNLSVAWKGVSKQYTDTANTQTIRGHGIINLGVVKKLNENIEVRANVNNITNQRILDSGEAIYVGTEYRIALTGRF